MCYIKYIIILMTKHIKNPFVISFVFLIFSIIFLSIFFNKISRDNLSEQIQHRQQLAVRSGAKSIGSFLRAVGRSVSVLSSDPSQERLDRFVESWKDDGVTGIISVNKNGKVAVASNRESKQDLGADVSDRNYFKWAKTASRGDYFIDTPVISKVGSSKDKYIVTVSVPVLDEKNNFNGVLVSAILVTDLVDLHLDNLKVLDSSKLYLVSNNGEMIYSDQEDLVGHNFKDIFTSDFLGKEKVLQIISSELKSEAETKVKIALPNGEEASKLSPYLISASPVKLEDQLWKVVISVPEKDLNVFTFNFFNKQILAVFAAVTVFILLTLRYSKDAGYDQAVVDEHQKHNIV